MRKKSKVEKVDRRSKKRPKTGGRQRGTPNKLSLATRQAVVDAFHAVLIEGRDAVVAWGKKHPGELMKIAAKLMGAG
jgi:hypothetical protein